MQLSQMSDGEQYLSGKSFCTCNHQTYRTFLIFNFLLALPAETNDELRSGSGEAGNGHFPEAGNIRSVKDRRGKRGGGGEMAARGASVVGKCVLFGTKQCGGVFKKMIDICKNSEI